LTKLEREWAAKLKASGFQDLEGSDRDGPLSNAGKLHAVAETADEHERLAARIEDGTAYQEWARSMLHATRWRCATDRRIWEMHCDGEGLRETTKRLGVSWKRATRVIDLVKAGRQGREGDKAPFVHEREEIRRLARRCEPRVLRKLVLVLVLVLLRGHATHAIPRPS